MDILSSKKLTLLNLKAINDTLKESINLNCKVLIFTTLGIIKGTIDLNTDKKEEFESKFYSKSLDSTFAYFDISYLEKMTEDMKTHIIEKIPDVEFQNDNEFISINNATIYMPNLQNTIEIGQILVFVDNIIAVSLAY